MDEIIRVKNEGYSRYEELLMQRDKLRKEAHYLQMEYMKEFGELITTVFEKKIACIQKKKTIAFCQAAVNRGEPIDQNALNSYIKQEMDEYQRQLQRMIAENDAAHHMTKVPVNDVEKIKKIYRRLAKVLHPDINPKTDEIPELKKLWNMVVVSYNSNSLEELEEAEILVSRALKKHNISDMVIEIPNLDEKIAKVEEEIHQIMGTDPYQYKYLLSDTVLMDEKRAELQKELEEYTNYEKELDQIMKQLIDQGVNVIWRMN